MKSHLLFAALLAGVLPLSAEVQSNLIDQFQQECRASFDEPWRSIPWKLTVLEGQNRAAEERKPIFIWAMDGHPLGCT